MLGLSEYIFPLHLLWVVFLRCFHSSSFERAFSLIFIAIRGSYDSHLFTSVRVNIITFSLAFVHTCFIIHIVHTCFIIHIVSPGFRRRGVWQGVFSPPRVIITHWLKFKQTT
ncbi:unnamed protein product, partial [Ectocarpus sp. 12 AP-2014]